MPSGGVHALCVYSCRPVLSEDVPLVELCALCLLLRQGRVTVGGSGLWCCVCLTSFKR